VFFSLGWNYIFFGLGTLAVGLVVFVVAAKASHQWPFAAAEQEGSVG